MAIILTGSEYVDLDAHGAALDIRQRPLAIYLELQTTSSNLMLPFAHGRGESGRQEYCLFMGISTAGRITGRWEDSDDTIRSAEHSGGYNDGALHRVCLIVRSSVNTNAVRLFVDGSQVGLGDTGTDLDTRDLNDLMRIGMDPDTAGREFIGQIANVAVWDVELTDANAEDLTDGTLTPGDLSTGLLEWWPLDYDSRGEINGLDGTDVGSPTYTEEPPSGGAVHISDYFNRANEALGAGPWTLVNWSGTDDGFAVVSSRCYVKSTNRSGAIHDTALETDDHYVEATLVDYDGGVAARFDDAGTTGYFVSVYSGAAELFKVEAGTVTYLDQTTSVATGQKVFLEVSGDQITWGQVGGTTKTITDTSITTGKRVGVAASGVDGIFDDFFAADATGVPPVRPLAIQVSADDTDTEVHTVALPSGSNVVGRRVVLVVSVDGGSEPTWPSGWESMGSGVTTATRIAAAYRDIDGTEGFTGIDDEITFDTALEEQSKHVAYLIDGHDPSVPPEMPTAATGSGANADSPSVTVSWGAEEALFISAAAYRFGASFSAAPDEYGDLVNLSSGDNNAPLGTAHRVATAWTEDPGAFTSVDGGSWAAITIAVRSAGGPPGAMFARYRASQLALSNGSPVGLWTDEAVGGNDLSQLDGARPTYEAAGFNGHPSVLFDDTDTQFMATGAYGAALSQPNTIVVMGEWVGLSDSIVAYLFDGPNGSQRNALFVATNVAGDPYRMFAGSTLTSTASPFGTEGDDICLVAIYNGGSSELHINDGGNTVSGTPNAQGLGGFTLAARYEDSGSEQRANFRVAEVLIYDRALTATEITELQTYFEATYIAEESEESSSSSSAGSSDFSGSGLPATLVLAPGLGEGSLQVSGNGASASLELVPGLGSGSPNLTGDGVGVELLLVPGLGQGTSTQGDHHEGSGLPVALVMQADPGVGLPAIAGDGAAVSLELLAGQGLGVVAVTADGQEVVLVLRPGVGMGYAGSYTYRSNRSLVALPVTRTLIPLED